MKSLPPMPEQMNPIEPAEYKPSFVRCKRAANRGYHKAYAFGLGVGHSRYIGRILISGPTYRRNPDDRGRSRRQNR